MRAQEETLRYYELYGDMFFRICFLRLKNRQDAYDAVQETFIRLIQSEKRFENEEHAKAWLFAVAGNICKNMQKEFWNKNRVNDDVFFLLSGEEEDMENSEVLEAVLALPEKYKELVYLHYYEGYSVEEIARFLGKNASTLRSRLSKAKELLRKKLV